MITYYTKPLSSYFVHKKHVLRMKSFKKQMEIYQSSVKDRIFLIRDYHLFNILQQSTILQRLTRITHYHLLLNKILHGNDSL